MATTTKNCECCGALMHVRSADLARGWGRFCSKSCKAMKQSAVAPRQRHDGLSEMKHKVCADCGRPAINGVHGLTGSIEWYCANHMADAMTHPFSEAGLNQ